MLYLELMEQMNKPMMDKHLASTTFKYIKILLRSDRIKTQVFHASANCLDLFTNSWICLLRIETYPCSCIHIIAACQQVLRASAKALLQVLYSC